MEKEQVFSEHKLVFIDLETTGTSPWKHEIIEIAYLIVNQKDLAIEEEYTAKTKPLHIETADKEAIDLVGYNEEEWKDALPLEEPLSKLAQSGKHGIAVGQVIHFDLMFLQKAYEDMNEPYPFIYHYLDTVGLAYMKLRDNPPESFSLGSLMRRFDIPPRTRAHRAMDDIRATYELFKRIVEK